MVSIDSPTYPFEQLQNYTKLIHADEIPRKICTYIMDMPSPGYQPKETNNYPRVRLMKYLYHDSADPLSEEVPTPQQKWAMLFDPLNPTKPPDTEKGYRIFPQSYTAQAQTVGETNIRCFMGPTIAKDSFQSELSVVFEITTNVNYESAAGFALSRVYAMECALIECLNGVNMGGVGTFYFDRRQHTSCGSVQIEDRGTNVGRRVILGLSWKD